MVEMKYPEAPVRILLGGGIGSGKSIAGRRFEELGANVVEADRFGHSVLERDGEAFRAVSERWPSVIVHGYVDRRALARIVFEHPDQLVELEALTHPAIINRIGEIASGADDLVVEIPLILIIPGDWTSVFVDADEDLRVRRAIERGGGDTDVRKRMASQPPRAEWMAWADEVVDNNGSSSDLETQVDALWHGLRTTDYGLRAES